MGWNLSLFLNFSLSRELDYRTHFLYKEKCFEAAR